MAKTKKRRIDGYIDLNSPVGSPRITQTPMADEMARRAQVIEESIAALTKWDVTLRARLEGEASAFREAEKMLREAGL